MSRLALLFLVVSGACYAPTIKDAQYLCPDGHCPSGQTCSACGICVSPHDAQRGGVACPGCSLGERSAGDFALPSLAVCGGAWTVPGVSADAPDSLATPCGRQPGNDGTSAVDHTTGCSVEDSCAAGWHLCAGESEVSSRGLTRQLCEQLDAQSGSFWVTREPGARGTKDVTAVSCATSGTVRLIGCGPLYATRETLSCSVLTRYIGEVPATSSTAAWDCAAHSDGAWQCGADGTEGLDVRKPSSAHGGVLCCRDTI